MTTTMIVVFAILCLVTPCFGVANARARCKWRVEQARRIELEQRLARLKTPAAPAKAKQAPPPPTPKPVVVHVPPEQQTTYVYRFYDKDQRLLYVGVTSNPRGRFLDHAGRPWWPEVASHQVIQYATRFQALAVEESAITHEGSLHNKQRTAATDSLTHEVGLSGYPVSHRFPLPAARRSKAEARS